MNRISLAELQHDEEFIQRHIGPSPSEAQAMLQVLGYESLDQLISATVPEKIRLQQPMDIASAKTEHHALADLKAMAGKNIINRSFIGTGYYNTYTPPVILRNVLENPGWYTAYTPYQPEIAQGRLEALLTFQQMIMDLTGMDLANASMLDEGTAAAEAMSLLKRVNTRAKPLGLEVVVGNPEELLKTTDAFGALIQYPGSYGDISAIEDLIKQAHSNNILITAATDLMALCLMTPPGELGADVVVGNSQRFGVPMGFGGPHAAFFATLDAWTHYWRVYRQQRKAGTAHGHANS
jgi:glycine dehydrogenase